MYILKVRENANSPWQLIDVLVGPRGENGHTPVKGVDYFTQEDIDFIVAEVEKGNYATVEYVDSMIENIPEVDLSDYYTKEQVDQAISADLGDYALKTDLIGLATEDYVDDAIAQAKLDGSDIDLSEYAKTADLAKVATTGNYNDLTNLPTIPSTTGFITMADVEAKGYLTEHQDLSAYALKTDIPSLEGYAKTTDIPDTTGFALKTEIPDVSVYALKTEIPSVEGLASEDYVDNAVKNVSVDLTDYYTAEQVDQKISEALSGFTDGEEVAY